MKDPVAAAGAMADFVNSLGCDKERFVAQMSIQHRTLQQSFTDLCFEWIRQCAKHHDDQNFDGRNEYSCEVCKKIVDAVEDVNYKMPLV